MTLPLSNRRLALVSGFALLAVLGAASVCNAESPWRRRPAAPVVAPYRVSLEAPDGAPLPTFQHAGTAFVLGEAGERYNVRVDNPTGERVEAVITVDGRDAVSGALGDYVAQRGYLIEPWGSLVVEGFRRSLDEVAAFRFTAKGQSYSARRGTPQHVGVVGVAVFPEKRRPPRPVARPPEPARPRTMDGGHDDSARGAAPAQRKSAGPSNIGTEYGESQASSVVEVPFERRSQTRPAAVLRLRYDDYRGLRSRGIDVSSWGSDYRSEPEPFPYSQSRFAPPPP
jgi:hypothetical protein